MLIKSACANARIGDSVFGQATGCLGTAVVADAKTLVAVPPQLTLEQASTVPTIFLTADACLRQSCALQAGQRVLIHAATGSLSNITAHSFAKKTGTFPYQCF
jgi:NADPH:quinone reductase-like Zn-dependent oxidoreductase